MTEPNTPATPDSKVLGWTAMGLMALGLMSFALVYFSNSASPETVRLVAGEAVLLSLGASTTGILAARRLEQRVNELERRLPR